MIEISSELARNVRHGLGDAGAAWLDGLPTLAAELCERWQITLGPPFELSFNYVAPAKRRDGSDAVFKIGPWAEEVDREIRTLDLYGGDGMCRLLESDLPRHAMLLERVRPGEMLLHVSTEDDDEATRTGARVMRRLWLPAAELPNASLFRPLASWFERAFERHRNEYGGPGPFPATILEHGERLSAELLASVPQIVLLHADFHHYNLLSSNREGWLAIDPKGMLGDPGYEVGPFMVNPWHTPDTASPRVLARRLDILADELGYDGRRLRNWSIAHCVLSACWSAENNGTDWRKAITTAENLLTL